MINVYSSSAAISDIMQAKTSAGIIASFRRFADQYHIDTFTSGEIDTNIRRRAVFHAMEWPDRWRNYYFQSGLLERDPLIEALPLMDRAFTWDELRARRALSHAEQTP
ncbi:MAG: autoinducer binding domain-containing protein [Rhizobium sp.]|nr:autoinducer binding domain-containing protein [Rhizobium sp.]